MAGYPDLVAPVVPDAQHNKSPEILLEGLRTGLAAFAQFAQIRRQQEMETLKLAAQERIAQDEHAIQREKIYKDSQYQDELLKSHALYYDAAGKALTTKADAYARGMAGLANQDEQKQEFRQAFQDRVDELKLNDPNLEKDDPAQYYLNAKELARNYGTSTMPDIRKAISSFKTRAEQHRIQLPQVAYDAEGNPKPAGQVAPQLVVGQIVEGLHNPDTRKQYLDRLKIGGYITPETQKPTGKKVKEHFWQKAWDEMQTVPESYTPAAENLINKADTADFGSGATVTQPDFGKKSRDFRAMPAEPAPDATPAPDASAAPASSATPDTDALMQAARDALKQGADPRAVSQRLADHGVDPSQLWG